MELRNLIDKMENNIVSYDDIEFDVNYILSDGKYNLLRNFLCDNNIYTTNDLKRISLSDYNKLKIKIYEISGVGMEKIRLFITELNRIRNDINVTVKKIEIGRINCSNESTIVFDYIKTDRFGNFLEILHQRGKNIQNRLLVKNNDIDQLRKIINNYDFNVDSDNEQLSIFSICPTDRIFNDDSCILKDKILDNEEKLLKIFQGGFGVSINLFKNKIESFICDGDIVKFLSNSSMVQIREQLYDLIHKYGYKTAIDIMNEYDISNFHSTTLSDLSIGQKVNTMTICALANNFNQTLGMYYDEINDILILKSQTSGGHYCNKWLEDYSLVYYLQNEKNSKYRSLDFSHRPNQVCRDIILKVNNSTKVYLFDRKNRGSDYTYLGEFKIVSFYNDNKCILLKSIDQI